MEPTKGTFKIQTVGPKNNIPNKKDPNRPWCSWGLQFEGDAQWYETFWVAQEDPKVGQELTGTKSWDDKFQKFKFETERQGGKGNWNPAGAQATVMEAAAVIVNGFFAATPAHYQLWNSETPEDAKKLKTLFDKYYATVVSVGKRLKDDVVGMGSMNPEQKTATKTATGGDPGDVAPPPNDDDFPGEEDTGL